MIGKWILIFGILLIVAGLVVWLIESLDHRPQHRADSVVEPVLLVLAVVKAAHCPQNLAGVVW